MGSRLEDAEIPSTLHCLRQPAECIIVSDRDRGLFEDVVLCLDVVILPRRRPVLRYADSRRAQPENRQPIRMRIRQRLQQQVLVTLKIAVFAPIPIASDRTITNVSPGFFISMRRP